MWGEMGWGGREGGREREQQGGERAAAKCIRQQAAGSGTTPLGVIVLFVRLFLDDMVETRCLGDAQRIAAVRL